MNALLIFTILALASPIFGEEAVDQKNQQKRGVVGPGYGSHYLGGYNSLNYGYNGLYRRYLSNPYYVGHPEHPYSAPLALGHGFNHAYHAPTYATPVRIPYAGYNLGHNLEYYSSW